MWVLLTTTANDSRLFSSKKDLQITINNLDPGSFLFFVKHLVSVCNVKNKNKKLNIQNKTRMFGKAVF